MPGIHVRTTSQFDWIEQEKESVLTVPGSYWLCHKKNIYKFIFRYHRMDRNVKEFEYVRELMKIIRRILKCQPHQGQQFGTRHLLVTYNHTSWTRQDKMFAMVKFRKRSNAAAFSRAFVLTIKIINPTDDISFTEERVAKSNKQDYLEILQNEDSDSVSSHSNRCRTFVTDQLSPANSLSSIEFKKIKNLDSALNNADIEGKLTNHISTCLISENSTSKADENVCTKTNRSSMSNMSTHSSTNSNTPVVMENIVTHEKNICKQTLTNSITSEQSEFESTSCSQQNVSVLHPQDAYGFTLCNISNSKACDKRMENADHQQSSNCAKDDISKLSVDLPFQYLIERDIEGTKCHTKSNVEGEVNELLKVSSDNSAEDESPSQTQYKNMIPEIHDQSHKDIKSLYLDRMKVVEKSIQENESKKLDANDCRPQKDNKELEGKGIPSNSILRSSNITDLVMEGLMFTIRQDQDSVKVVEQKTKLEVDEVLENSEKAETKEGGKRLVNSSLLRLENLVTMIELSTGANKADCKSTYIEKQKPFLELHDISHSRTPAASPKYIVSSNETSMRSVSEEHKYDIQLDQTRDVEEMEEKENDEEDEDIIPEAFQSHAFQVTELSKEDLHVTNAYESKYSSSHQDLLMDDMEIESKTMYTSKIGAMSRNSTTLCNVNQDTKTHCKDENTTKNSRGTNVPRVISNEVITVDQMPPALQNAIKNKLLRRRSIDRKCNYVQNDTFQNSNAYSNNDNVVVHQKSVENSVLNIDISENLLTTSADNSFNDETNEIENEFSTLDNVEQINKSSITIDEDVNINLRFKNAEISKCILYSEHSKQFMSSKLEDITEDFYKDLLQEQRKDIDHRKSLRQRRKSSSIVGKQLQNNEIRVEMLKFIQDITKGAKVVLERLSTKDISKKIGNRKSSFLRTSSN